MREKFDFSRILWYNNKKGVIKMDLFTIMLISFVSLVYYIVPIALIVCFPILLIKEIIPYLIFTIKFYLMKKRL